MGCNEQYPYGASKKKEYPDGAATEENPDALRKGKHAICLSVFTV